LLLLVTVAGRKNKATIAIVLIGLGLVAGLGADPSC